MQTGVPHQIKIQIKDGDKSISTYDFVGHFVNLLFDNDFIKILLKIDFSEEYVIFVVESLRITKVYEKHLLNITDRCKLYIKSKYGIEMPILYDIHQW